MKTEKLIWKSEATPDTINKLEDQGITPIVTDDTQTKHEEVYGKWE